MLASILQIKLATAMMNAWFAVANPMPLPGAAFALAFDAHVVSPVEVPVFDVNRNLSATLYIERDGSTDAATKKHLTHLFRCRTDHEHPIFQKTLAMLADLSDHFAGRRFELVSGYRVREGEPSNSPHRDARAIDFRITGVKLTEIRDYLWRSHTHVGIGWYPEQEFIHMDSRPTMNDTSWTFYGGKEHYHPTWADAARDQRPKPVRPRDRTGV
jgi:uncharacterized protein YcbK (DUF882 family)